MNTKLCHACQTEKPTSEFYPIKTGFHSECKACSKARYNEWRRKNREKHAERNNDWFREHRDVVLARQRLYHVRLGDERKRRRVGEHYKNAERNCDRVRLWKKANPEKARLIDCNREARKRSHPHTWTVDQMTAALAHFDNCCPVCGVDLNSRRHWDHWIPLASPTCPGTVASNMVPLCGRCNTRKNDATPGDWLKRMFPTTWEQIQNRVEAYLSSLLGV